MGGLVEVLTTSTRTHWKHRIFTPSGEVQVIRRNDGSSDVYYMTTDHLGSTDTVMDASATILARESFGAWGARRSSNWQGSPSPGEWQSIANTTRRGYTGHEELDNILLVHMNGRVYDPAIGRFLAADPYVSCLANSQAWNRYTYVRNRPLAGTDPTGYFEEPGALNLLPVGAGLTMEQIFVDSTHLYDSGPSYNYSFGGGGPISGLPLGGEGLEELIVSRSRLHPPPLHGQVRMPVAPIPTIAPDLPGMAAELRNANRFYSCVERCTKELGWFVDGATAAGAVAVTGNAPLTVAAFTAGALSGLARSNNANMTGATIYAAAVAHWGALFGGNPVTIMVTAPLGAVVGESVHGEGARGAAISAGAAGAVESIPQFANAIAAGRALTAGRALGTGVGLPVLGAVFLNQISNWAVQSKCESECGGP